MFAVITQYPDDLIELDRVMAKALQGADSGVMLEVTCRSRWASVSGVYAEDEAVRAGVAAHNTAGKRWMLPEQFLSLTAFWVPCHGKLCDDLPGMMSSLDAP